MGCLWSPEKMIFWKTSKLALEPQAQFGQRTRRKVQEQPAWVSRKHSPLPFRAKVKTKLEERLI